MNKKKKSTNTFPYPDEVIDRLARAFYPAILACWNSEEGQREFAAWQAEQARLTGTEKQEAPVGELPVVHIAVVCGFWQGASGWTHPVFYFVLNLLTNGSQPYFSNILPARRLESNLHNAILFGIRRAFPDLAFDEFFALIVAGIAGVDYSGHRRASLRSGWGWM